LIKQKRRANVELGRDCLLEWDSVLKHESTPGLVCKVLKSEKPEPRGKACCHLGSGTLEGMR